MLVNLALVRIGDQPNVVLFFRLRVLIGRHGSRGGDLKMEVSAEKSGRAALPETRSGVPCTDDCTGQAVEREPNRELRSALRILLADDHVIVREALRALLEREGFSVVAEASDGQEAVRLAQEVQPCLAILDLSMPVLNGFDACREILRVSPQTNVIVLSVHTEEPYVLEALRAGVRGYAIKCRSAAGLITAIREVLEGDIYLSPGIAKTVVQAYLAEKGYKDCLSTRERQVVQLIAEGMATKEVAALLGISVKTAESHRNRIMQKLDIHDTAGMVRYAVRRGLTEA